MSEALLREVAVKQKYIQFHEMTGVKHIEAIRSYLDYMEEHLFNIRKAFEEVSDACDGMPWVGDDCTWWSFRDEVINHDLSKFSSAEFIPYVEAFFPVDGEDKKPLGEAWEHHKQHNHHHWETAEHHMDVVHMVIDWTAMSYKFGGTAKEYYEENAESIKLDEDNVRFMYSIFEAIEKGRGE